MLRNDDIQAGLITYLKAQTTVVALLAASTSIKEDQWQGTTFVYPAVRVQLGTLMPVADCNKCKDTFSVLCFSESASSQEADNLAGEVNDRLHNKAFTRNSIRYLIYSTGLIPAIRQDERTWRAEATFKAIVEPAA